MPNVIVTTDPFELSEYVLYETDDLVAFIRDQFPVWPLGARIYEGNVSEDCDITPVSEAGIAYLSEVEGTVYIIVYPEGPLAIAVAAIAVAVISVAAFLFLTPQVPDLGSTPSANNTLGDRSNKARPNSRIPDIYGQVLSVCDLLAQPYRIFEGNREVEFAYMCVGRGSYAIDNVRDGDTLIGSIAGAGAAFYGPNTSPNFGLPQLEIGSTITQDLYSVVKLNEVNGQTLSPSNTNAVYGSMRFIFPNIIENDHGFSLSDNFDGGQTIDIAGGSFVSPAVDLTLNASVKFEDGGVIRFQTVDPGDYFEAGDVISLSNASYSGLDDGGIDYLFVDLLGTYSITAVGADSVTLDSPELVNADWDKLVDYASDETEYKVAQFYKAGVEETIILDGQYVIAAVSDYEITLSSPESINADWLKIANFPSEMTPYTAVNVSTNGVSWVGWYDIDLADLAGNKVVFNIVARQGVYGINKAGEQYPREEYVTAEIRPIDKDGNVLGATETASTSLKGSVSEKKQIAKTLELMPTFTGRAQVRMRRTSPTDLDPKRQAIDELQWDSCYGLSPVPQDHFGDVTTVFTRTYATQSATSIKERRFNALVTRKVPEWDGTEFGDLVASTNAADILCAAALDPYIGNRSIEELNVQQIYDEVALLETYFGITEAAQFNYTFDDDNLSFEQTAATIAEAVFSTAYRVGNVLHLYAEVDTAPNNINRLIFNHRNKLPKSETRTVTFGYVNDYDGVELTYINPDDDVQTTIYIPDDQSARNPKKIETVGVRHESQATLHANRAYNKIRYQNTATSFEALEEAETLIRNNRVLIADNTRTDTIDGHVVSQVGLILELSQPFTAVDGVEYTIYLQHADGTVEAIAVEAGDDQWHAVLAEAPASALSLGPDQSVVAVYWIVGNNEPRASAFILTEIEVADKNTFSVTAINYDARYYANDQDFV